MKTKAGTLLAFAEARRTWCADSQEIDLVLRRSEDDGRTWSAAQTVLSGTDSDPNAVATRGNPAPIVDYDTGRIVCSPRWTRYDEPPAHAVRAVQ